MPEWKASIMMIFALLMPSVLGNGAVTNPQQDPEFLEPQRLITMLDQEEAMMNQFNRHPPDIHVVLSGVLHWQAMMPTYKGSFRTLPGHMPSPAGMGDKFSGFPPGFVGTRGKRPLEDSDAQERRDLPVFSNGFPAGRG